MAPTQSALVSGVANEDGIIESESLSIDTDIDIRQDDLRQFETESKRLLLTTADLDDGVYLEIIPSPEGAMAEVVEEPTVELIEVTPADRQEKSVDDATVTEVEYLD